MKKTIYLIIISVLTIGCIVFGAMYHVRGHEGFNFRNWISIGKSFSGDFDWDFDVDDSESGTISLHLRGNNGEDGAPGKSSVVNRSISEALPSFSSIDLHANVMSITIKYGDNYSLKSNYNREYLKPVWEVKNDVLSVTQNMPKRTSGNNNCSLTIVIPKNTDLGKVTLKLNVGEIKISDLAGDKLKIKNNVGEISAKDVNFNKIDVENNVGEVNITVVDDLSEYSIDASTDVGALSVDGNNYKRSYSRHVSSKKSIEVKTNVGELRIR